mgnify:FL=1
MKIGFTIGKFAPFHKGHEELIKVALREMDKVYVLINDTSVTNMPLEERAKCIKELYPDVNIILGKNPPDRYGMDEESIKVQTDYLKSIFQKIPVTHFYSSEEYGKFVARDLNVVDRRIEKEIPISATIIRKDINKNKMYLEESVYKKVINY